MPAPRYRYCYFWWASFRWVFSCSSRRSPCLRSRYPDRRADEVPIWSRRRPDSRSMTSPVLAVPVTILQETGSTTLTAAWVCYNRSRITTPRNFPTNRARPLRTVADVEQVGNLSGFSLCREKSTSATFPLPPACHSATADLRGAELIRLNDPLEGVESCSFGNYLLG